MSTDLIENPNDRLVSSETTTSVATNTRSGMFTTVSENTFQTSLNAGNEMMAPEISGFSINQPYASAESAAKKFKSLRLARRRHGLTNRLFLETIYEKRPLSVHQTGINWLDFKRKQEELRLCRSIFLNDTAKVDELLKQGVNPNCYDWQDRTPLHLAASRGYTQMVRLLLFHGADPNLVDTLGNIPLHLAACTNNEDVVLLLLNGGTNVNSIDLRGRSPLQLAKSKLRLIQMSKSSSEIKDKVTKIIEMLLVFLKKKTANASSESELLECFQNRLKISETNEQVNNEIDNLSKMLEQMQCSSAVNGNRQEAK